jgi:hypothetical protein
MKYTTWLIDYMYLGANLYFIDMFLSKNFTPQNVLFHQMANCCFVVAIDILKCLLFAPLLAKVKVDQMKNNGKELVKALFNLDGIKGNLRFLVKLLKGEGTISEWSDDKTTVRKDVRYNIWYFIKIGLVSIPAVVAAQVNLGLFSCEPLNEVIYVIGEGEAYECHISRFLRIYLEFLIIAFIKDGISMNILHQMFHTRFYDHHKTHHLPMKELSVMNAFYFDVFDLFAEDGVGPLLLIGIKAMAGGTANVHYASYLLTVLCDQTVHSLDPYTAVFWNPLLDNVMRGAISHNLHHSLNRGHYTIWPLHHLIGVDAPNNKSGSALDGFECDIKEYNKTFDTHFPPAL